MSPRQTEPGLKTELNYRSPSSLTKKRRGILSHRRFGLMVTLLEERTLLSTATLTTLGVSSSSLNLRSERNLHRDRDHRPAEWHDARPVAW